MISEVPSVKHSERMKWIIQLYSSTPEVELDSSGENADSKNKEFY